MKKWLLPIISIIVVFGAYGQVQFVERTVIDQSSSVIFPKDVLSIDIDGDGDEDVVTASYDDHKIAWYENKDGQGTYGPQRIISINAINAVSVFAIDIDGDGDNDILSASEGDNTIAWYENLNGLGSFGNPIVISNQAQAAKVVFAKDIDSDGDIDVICASSDDGKIAWYENLDGEGTFGFERLVSNVLKGVNSIHVSDIDGDGDQDILSTNAAPAEVVNGVIVRYKDVTWYENLDGQGNFGNARLIEQLSSKSPTQVKSADIDNDGDQDIVIATSSSLNWYENTDGLGTFIGRSQIVQTSGLHFDLADINMDGYIDILRINKLNQLGWHYGSANASFPFQEIVNNEHEPGGQGTPENVKVGDINGDGYPDVLLALSVHDKITSFKNQPGTNDFGPQSYISRNAKNVQQVKVGDIDGDGDLDIASSGGIDDKIAWYENTDGLGTFGLQKLISTELYAASSLDIKDMDGDGDLDILAVGNAHSGSLNRPMGWFENIDGLGTFSEALNEVRLSMESSFVLGVDIDNDNDIDIVSSERTDSNGNNAVVWYENKDGQGTFKDIGAWEAYGSTIAAGHAIGDSDVSDLDGDGDMDILYSEFLGDKIAWSENTDGLGSFTPAAVINDNADNAKDVESADLDGDGDMDVISLNQIYLNPDNIIWHENVGGLGTFENPRAIDTFRDGLTSIFPADIDGDGDMDVISSSVTTNLLYWYENFNGNGGFTNPHTIGQFDSASSAIAADINGDGKIDIISTSVSNGAIAWFQNIDSPNPEDIDGDGVLNSIEDTDGTNPDDGCSYLEASQDINLISVLWKEADCDNDGILNGTELTNGSDPRNQDSDGDGVLDNDDSNATDPCFPVQNQNYVGYDATSTIWSVADCDGDGTLNGEEANKGTDPYYDELFHADAVVPETFSEQRIPYTTNNGGRGVGISNSTIAISASGSPAGKVTIFTRNNEGVWEEGQTLLSSDGDFHFGNALAIQDDILAVGQRIVSGGGQPGSVYIFERGANGNWSEIQKITASDGSANNLFGHALSLSGNTLLIGSYGDTSAPRGSAYIFERLADGSWVEAQKLIPIDNNAPKFFGKSVAISGNQLVIGAPGSSGGAYIFEKQANGVWLEIQKITTPSGFNSGFGESVAIIRNRISIGDLAPTEFDYGQGQTLVYERVYGGNWLQVQQMEASDGYDYDFFGDEMAKSNDKIIVNASADYADAGSLYVFHKTNGTWTETHKFRDGALEEFGQSVSTEGNIIVASSLEYLHIYEGSFLESDGDGVIDQQEILDATDENDPCSFILANQTETPDASWDAQDCDSDTVTNADELVNGTDPLTPDTDGDGVDDADDLDPLSPCLPTQAEGYTDFDSNNTIWASADCDNDGTNNEQEISNGSDPYKSETDMSLTSSTTDITCAGSNDGSITANVNGGTLPYNYELIDTDNTVLASGASNLFTDLFPGQYSIRVTDNSAKVLISGPISITEPIELSINTEIVDETCPTASNGEVTINVGGGTGQYQYQLDNGQFISTNIFTQLAAGDYTVTVRDEKGCTLTELITVSNGTDCSGFTLPSNNFTLQATSETCASSNNGSILITATENLNYAATLKGGAGNLVKTFSTFTSFQNLEAGFYEVCITVASHPEYEKCFSVQINEPEDLQVDSELDPSGKMVTLKMKGGMNYTVDVNGTEYNTSENEITLPLSKVQNSISVKTDADCQGIHEETVLATYTSVSIYPNPVEKGDVTIQLPDNEQQDVLLTLFSQNGIRIAEKLEKSDNGTVKMNIDGMPSGIYTIVITTDSTNSMRRIIKN